MPGKGDLPRPPSGPAVVIPRYTEISSCKPHEQLDTWGVGPGASRLFRRPQTRPYSWRDGGLVALLLAMAFAISSGLPQAGIYCAIVTGFLISALGVELSDRRADGRTPWSCPIIARTASTGCSCPR